MKVVFDTNVLFSAIGWKGTAYQCLEVVRNGKAEGLTCQEILDELTEKLDDKLQFSEEQIAETLADLLSCFSVVRISNDLKVVKNDPDDDKVIECAVVGKANYIVTGDRKHILPLGHYGEIQIVSPSDFLALKEFNEE